MSSSVELSKDIILSLYHNQDRGYVNMYKGADSFVQSNAYLNVDKEYVRRSIELFDRFNGLLSNGNRITLTGKDPFFKITCAIELRDLVSTNKMHKMSDVLSQELPGFYMYIDGKKVPDDEIIFFPCQSNTDIFLPLVEWQNLEEPRLVYFETVSFHNKEYIHYYNKNFVGTTFKIECKHENDNHVDESDFNPQKGLVFIDGALIGSDKYTVTYEDNEMRVTFAKTTKGSVEFCYQPGCSYKKYKSYEVTQSLYRLVFAIEKNNYKPILRGGVPKSSVSVFIDGLRVPDWEITQIGRQHYAILKENDTLDFKEYAFIVQDFDKIDDNSWVLFGSDYYLQKMVGDKIEDMLKHEPSGTVLDDHIGPSKKVKIDKIMNSDLKLYNEEQNATFFNYLRNSETDVSTKLAQIIDRNPNAAKDLMSLFSKRKSMKIIKTGEVIDEGIFTIAAPSIINNNSMIVNYDLFIDGKYVNTKNYTIDNNNGSRTLMVNNSVLKTNSANLVELNETITLEKDSNFYSKKVFNSQLERLEDNSGFKMSYLLRKEEYGEKFSGNIEDVILLIKTQDDDELLYPYSNKIGYIQYGGATILKNAEGIVFLFKEEIWDDVVIYFKNFYFRTSFEFYPGQDQALENMAFISVGSSDEPLPIIAKGTPKLFVNDDYYLYGIDYTFVTPENNQKMAGSAISFIRNTAPGSVISFSIDNVSNKILLSKYSIKYDSKYGLLYFSNLQFPFSLDYLELYIDGNKVTHSMVQILSDKLIRIRGLKVPFNDIYLATTFTTDYTVMEKWAKYYKPDPFEKIIATLFRNVDYTIENEEINPPNDYDVDEIYESFDSGVGLYPGQSEEGNKDKNETKSEAELPSRVSQYVEKYVEWIISADARSIIDMGNKISPQVIDYFTLYNFGFGSVSKDIEVDCGVCTLSSKNDLVINGGARNYTKQEILLDFVQTVMKTYTYENAMEPISSNEAFEVWKKNPVSNKYLPENFPLFMRTRNFENQLPGNIVIPTTPFTDYEEKESLKDIKIFNIEF